MTRHALRRVATGVPAAALVLGALVGCGGEDGTGPSATSAADPADAADPLGDGSGGGLAEEVQEAGSSSGGAGQSLVRVDGQEYPFSFHGFTADDGAATINGVSEVCDPDFLGAGFLAEGYLVDDTGEVVFDNSVLAGRVRLTLPAPGNEATVPADVSVQVVADGIDAADTLGEGVPGDFTVDGATASGRFEVPRRGTSRTTYDVELEVTCPQ
ncbi:MAG: hypothetical protein CMJ44_07305 [Pimelobacter sp.]|nr:hypothetical protein [Pimelobacter sp.]